MIKKILMLIIGFVLIGALLPALWPVIEGTAGDVAGMNATTVGGEFIVTLWPILLVIAGIGIGAALIFWALRQLGVFGTRH